MPENCIIMRNPQRRTKSSKRVKSIQTLSIIEFKLCHKDYLLKYLKSDTNNQSMLDSWFEKITPTCPFSRSCSWVNHCWSNWMMLLYKISGIKSRLAHQSRSLDELTICWLTKAEAWREEWSVLLKG